MRQEVIVSAKSKSKRLLQPDERSGLAKATYWVSSEYKVQLIYFFMIAATPGNSFPSKYSRSAPPPVDT